MGNVITILLLAAIIGYAALVAVRMWKRRGQCHCGCCNGECHCCDETRKEAKRS